MKKVKYDFYFSKLQKERYIELSRGWLPKESYKPKFINDKEYTECVRHKKKLPGKWDDYEFICTDYLMVLDEDA